MRIILCTVGTSVLGNIKRSEGLETPTDHALAAYLKKTPAERASAETNSLSRMMTTGDKVVFLHSATDDGRRCAAPLVKWCEDRGVRAARHEIEGLTYDLGEFRLKGLIALSSALAREVRAARSRGDDVVINGTGGFKAEVAVAAQVAAVFGVPMYYMHEAFRDVVEIPAAPLSWDFSTIAEYEDLFEWVLSETPTVAQFEAKYPKLPAEVGRLIATEAGRRVMSPLAEAYYEAFLDRIASAASVPVLLSDRARATYAEAEPSVREKYDGIIARLRIDGIRSASAKQEPNCDCLSFPSGRYYERLFFWSGDDRVLRIVELCRHDRGYDKLIQEGVRRSAYGDRYFPM